MLEPSVETPIVHLVDDDDALRTAVLRLLRIGGFEVRDYSSASEFLIARQSRLRGCLVLDVRMPGGPSGLELHKALARQGESLPVIFLTGHGDIPMCIQAMKNGAFDFLTKPVERDALLQAVRSALDHEEANWRASAHRRQIVSRANRLTPAEREVFRRIVQGQPNKQVASELECSERTVKFHRAQVMTKMGAASLADLVHFSRVLQPQPVAQVSPTTG
jgi:FixJ family two-component response regulator